MMRTMLEDMRFMADRMKLWEEKKNKRAHAGMHAEVTCLTCGKELRFTGKNEHIEGPFWELEVECKEHGIVGTKIVEYSYSGRKTFEHPTKSYLLSDADYEMLKKRLKALRIWAKKPQPKKAGSFHLNIIDTWIGELNVTVASNAAVIFDVDERRYHLSTYTKRRIKKTFLEAGCKLKAAWNDKSSSRTLSLKLGGNTIAIDMLHDVYNAGCKRFGTFTNNDGERKSHEKSVFCRCGWLGSARKKMILPEGWE